MMQYLRCTRELTLMIEPSTDAQWWVDSSYMVHPDMRSHSGFIMTLGKGVMYSHLVNKSLKLFLYSLTQRGRSVPGREPSGQASWHDKPSTETPDSYHSPSLSFGLHLDNVSSQYTSEPQVCIRSTIGNHNICCAFQQFLPNRGDKDESCKTE